ncbi:MAG TPA: hypothetical protein VHF24_11655 [Acidimicrobiales bacterium]|nr:hypothetical protein [Acidimicrobiales bacterium]
MTLAERRFEVTARMRCVQRLASEESARCDFSPEQRLNAIHGLVTALAHAAVFEDELSLYRSRDSAA